MVAVDMFSLRKNGSHKVGIKEALAWSGLWVAVSCLFAGWLYIELAGNPVYGAAVAKEKVLEFFYRIYFGKVAGGGQYIRIPDDFRLF